MSSRSLLRLAATLFITTVVVPGPSRAFTPADAYSQCVAFSEDGQTCYDAAGWYIWYRQAGIEYGIQRGPNNFFEIVDDAGYGSTTMTGSPPPNDPNIGAVSTEPWNPALRTQAITVPGGAWREVTWLDAGQRRSPTTSAR